MRGSDDGGIFSKSLQQSPHVEEASDGNKESTPLSGPQPVTFDNPQESAAAWTASGQSAKCTPDPMMFLVGWVAPTLRSGVSRRAMVVMLVILLPQRQNGMKPFEDHAYIGVLLLIDSMFYARNVCEKQLLERSRLNQLRILEPGAQDTVKFG